MMIPTQRTNRRRAPQARASLHLVADDVQRGAAGAHGPRSSSADRATAPCATLVLTVLRTYLGGWSIAALASAVGMRRGDVFRALAALSQRRLVYFAPDCAGQPRWWARELGGAS